jgi:hypothetical protein
MKVFEVIRTPMLNHINNDQTITNLKDAEIYCIDMSLIEVYNGLVINTLLGAEKEVNKKTWVDSVGRILGPATKVE